MSEKFKKCPLTFDNYFSLDVQKHCECTNDDCSTYKLEKCFELERDPHMPNGELCAKVVVNIETNTINNRAVLRRCDTGLSDEATCVHTITNKISWEDIPKDHRDIVKVYEKEAQLEPEGHFFALQSWIEGITVSGLEESLRIGMDEASTFYSGMNADMVAQFHRMINKVYKKLGNFISIDILNDLYEKVAYQEKKEPKGKKGVYRTDNLYDDYYSILASACCLDKELYDKCKFLFPNKYNQRNIHEKCIDVEDTSEEVIKAILQNPDESMGELIAHSNFSVESIEQIIDTAFGFGGLVFKPTFKINLEEYHSRYDKDDEAHETIEALNATVRWGIAKNPNLTPDLIKYLSKAEDINVRIAIAKHPKITEKTLNYLANDTNTVVRQVVARNEKASIDTLLKLSMDTHSGVKKTLLRNPNLPLEAYMNIANDNSTDMRNILAKDKEILPPEVVKRLLLDIDDGVVATTITHQDVSTDWLRYFDEGSSSTIKKAVAANINTPLKSLIKLSKDKDVRVQENVAMNPKTPQNILYDYAIQKEYGTNKRLSISNNYASSSRVLKALAQSAMNTHSVHQNIINHINVTPEIKMIIGKAKELEFLQHEIYALSRPLRVLFKERDRRFFCSTETCGLMKISRSVILYDFDEAIKQLRDMEAIVNTEKKYQDGYDNAIQSIRTAIWKIEDNKKKIPKIDI